MKKFITGLVISTCFIAVLTGCESTPFIGKQLNPEARGIATVRSTPYGCQVLGEAEGKDYVSPYTQGYNMEMLRDSALNDLRNQAAEIVSRINKRITLRILSEQPICPGECSKNYPELTTTGYKVTAQIFECGEKDPIVKSEPEKKSRKR